MGLTYRCLNDWLSPFTDSDSVLKLLSIPLQHRSEKAEAKLPYGTNICHKWRRRVNNSAPLTDQLKMYFITQFSVSGWVVRRRAIGFSVCAFLFAAYAQGFLKRKELCNGNLSFHFYDFPRILWRVWKDRHVYEGFQMVQLAPPAFSSVLGPWRINQSQWQGLMAKHCGSH